MYLDLCHFVFSFTKEKNLNLTITQKLNYICKVFIFSFITSCGCYSLSIFTTSQPELADGFADRRPTILGNFCYKPGYWLYVFDANGNNYADMTCHSSTGHLQIAEGHIYYHESK